MRPAVRAEVRGALRELLVELVDVRLEELRADDLRGAGALFVGG